MFDYLKPDFRGIETNTLFIVTKNLCGIRGDNYAIT